MKPRYVFSVVVAAASIGAGVGYSLRPPVVLPNNEKPTSVPQATEGIEERYRIIADLLASLCSMDYQPNGHEFDNIFPARLQAMEKEWADETEKFRNDLEVSRVGPLLRIKTNVREVEFLDAGYFCHFETIQLYRYKGRVTSLQWHFVESSAYESKISILVSPATGETLHLLEKLIVSPSGDRLAASNSSYFKGLQIFRTTSDGPVAELEWNDESTRLANMPAELSQFLDVIGWVDDETLLLAMEPERLMGPDRQAKLFRRDGKWQLEYFDQ